MSLLQGIIFAALGGGILATLYAIHGDLILVIKKLDRYDGWE